MIQDNQKVPDIDALKRVRRMGRRMLDVYAKIDAAVAPAVAEAKPSCKVGCAGCCHLLALVTLPEAVAIAEDFLADVSKRQMIPLLMQSFVKQATSIDVSDMGTVRQKYFSKKVACTFLDPETNLCTVYATRPGACRYYFVQSDPKLCSPEAGSQTVAQISLPDADLMVLSEAARVSKQTKLPLYVAPLPVMMLWAFKILIEGPTALTEGLKDPELGVLNLEFWNANLSSIAPPQHAEIAAP